MDGGLRLAYRLARFNPRYRTGHELLDALTPREWAYWCMSEKLDPAGGHHELASLVASQVINALHGIAAGLGGGQLSEEHMLPVDAFVPWRKRRDVAAEKLDDSLAALERLRGL